MGSTTFSGPVTSTNGFIAPTYTVATQPDATAVTAGTVIYVSDGYAGAPTLAVSNETIWVGANGIEIAAS
jgi:hypothetical protein